jgi:hypothetical protein
MFRGEFRRCARFLRRMLGFGWPWLFLGAAIKTWPWALASGGSDDAIPALVITMVVFTGPIFRTLSGEKAWHAIGGLVGVAAFSFAVINTFLAPHLTAEGIRAASYRPGPDESYAKVETQYQLVLYFYLWMAVFIVVAVGSVVIALSRLRLMIETFISIRERGVHYWRYRFWPQDQRKLNRALAFSLTQFICTIFFAYGASEAAIWLDEMEDGGSFYDSALKSQPTWAQTLAEGYLYENNAPIEYILNDRLTVPQYKLKCSNFGRYDLIRQIGDGRVDVIPQPMTQISPSEWRTQRQAPLQNVPCVSTLAG